MQYTLTIDLKFMHKFYINPTQACLMAFFKENAETFQKIRYQGSVWMFCPRADVLKELSAIFKTDDTVYRAYKALKEKGLIKYVKSLEKDLIAFTSLGNQWQTGKK